MNSILDDIAQAQIEGRLYIGMDLARPDSDRMGFIDPEGARAHARRRRAFIDSNRQHIAAYPSGASNGH